MSERDSQRVVVGDATLYHGDCLDVMATLAPNSVDAIVTDPPYGLAFMGQRWDYDVPSVDVWAECLRVLKPGGHVLSFAGTRTHHRMAVRVEDAGFEIRDMIAWVYGSGFPKSLDVSKAIDKAAGAEREVIGAKVYADGNGHAPSGIYYTDEKPIPQSGAPRNITAPATEAARQWEGYGTALKPAMEPILVARKPLDGTVAANVMAHGTGALNIDGCRIAAQAGDYDHPGNTTDFSDTSKVYGWATSQGKFKQSPPSPNGRWPANLIHDGSEEVVALFPVTTSGILKAGTKRTTAGGYHGGFPEIATHYDQGGDHGSAARFFYTAKASKKDREEENIHPTVKPTDLMRYLVRLVTPPGGVVLDPFTGSGSTGKAAMLEGFRFIGIEREAAYFVIACQRLDDAQRQGRLDLELPA